MVRSPAGAPNSPEPSYPSDARLWAEQLALGLALGIAIVIFMALFHQPLLIRGGEVLTSSPLPAFGWGSWIGLAVIALVHEAAGLGAAWWWRLPLRIRFFAFGANAAATLFSVERRALRDATIGLAGPVCGTLLAFGCALIYRATGDLLFLALACTGYFYNLLTLVPILDLEGGWIARAISPAAWLFGLVACVVELTHGFNLVLLGVVAFGLPRFLLILRARAPRTDRDLPQPTALILAVLYFALILLLGWLGTATFEFLRQAIPAYEAD